MPTGLVNNSNALEFFCYKFLYQGNFLIYNFSEVCSVF